MEKAIVILVIISVFFIAGCNLDDKKDDGRSYKVYVPKKYDPVVPTPLMLVFHGASGTANRMIDMARMNNVADNKGFIVVYPEGEKIYKYGSWRRVWNAGNCANLNNAADVQFVRDLLDKLSSEFNIDENRIFVTGLSNGGMFAQRLACDLSDRIAAVASVAGALALDYEDCNPEYAIPIIHFHAKDDGIVPYEGGDGSEPTVSGCWKKSIPNVMSFWALVNNCDNTDEVTFKNGDAECITRTNPVNQNQVTLCTTESGGHSWPGAASDVYTNPNQNIRASTYMWDHFFQYIEHK